MANAEMKKEEKINKCINFKSNKNGTVVVKWNDNSIVPLASNDIPVFSIYPVSRFSIKQHKRVKVNQPEKLFVYNCHMG